MNLKRLGLDVDDLGPAKSINNDFGHTGQCQLPKLGCFAPTNPDSGFNDDVDSRDPTVTPLFQEDAITTISLDENKR